MIESLYSDAYITIDFAQLDLIVVDIVFIKDNDNTILPQPGLILSMKSGSKIELPFGNEKMAQCQYEKIREEWKIYKKILSTIERS
jgi:hypothetical protein